MPGRILKDSDLPRPVARSQAPVSILMPRRRKSGVSIGQVIGLVGGISFLIIVAGIVLYLFLGNPAGTGDPGTTRRTRVSANELSLSDYLDNANALRGNAYRVSGRVEEQLRWTPDRGRLISLLVDGSDQGSPIPILLPAAFSHLNLEKGTQFSFVVEVRNNGLLVATEAKPG
jgi:hypothetical protein